VIEAELRTSDYSAVSFGDKWSVADEWRRFRPVYWGRHLLHLLLGVLALLALALSLPAPPTCAARRRWSRSGPRMHQSPTYTDAAQLAENPPKWASYVSLKGEGRCEIDMDGHKSGNARHDGTPRDRLHHACAGTAGARRARAGDSGASWRSAAPTFIRASENGMAASLIAMLRMQMGQAPDPLAAYRARERARWSCATSTARWPWSTRLQGRRAFRLPVAATLQRAIVNAVDATLEKDGTDTPIRSWAALAASAAARPGKRRPRGVAHQLASLQRAARQAVDSLVAEQIEAARPAIVPAKGGVVLASTAPIGDLQRKPAADGEADAAEAADAARSMRRPLPTAEAEDADDDSLLGRWARLQRNAARRRAALRARGPGHVARHRRTGDARARRPAASTPRSGGGRRATRCGGCSRRCWCW
jgi:hypothetical protein